MSKKNSRKDEHTLDLFASAELFPVRRPQEAVRAVDLSLRIKTGMSRAMKEAPDSAEMLAARISEMRGRQLSTDMLYAYTAASKPEQEMGITTFVAFVRATGADWLWDELVRDDGLVVLKEREALLAQVGHLQQQKSRIDEQLRALQGELKADPVSITTTRRGGRS